MSDEQAFITGGTVNGDAFGTTVLDVSGTGPPPPHSSNDSTTSESSTFLRQQAFPPLDELLVHRL
jgi:hypothetical protein